MTTESERTRVDRLPELPSKGVPQQSQQNRGAAAPDVLVTIGDIACTQTELLTPNGVYPLAHTNWIVTNNTTTREKIPTYAIVLAIVFTLLCLVGLLFLLVKERTIEGTIQVSVQSPEVFYATQILITDPQEVLDVEKRVNYARGLVRALS